MEKWVEKGRVSNKKSCEGEGDGENSIVSVMIDTKVLDCFICSNPLKPPVHQSINGHIACSHCYKSFHDECSVCKLPMDIPCTVLEPILASIKVPCIYAGFGCEEYVPYSQKHEHEDYCAWAPCSCPISGCTFHSFGPQPITTHIRNEHPSSRQVSFSYGDHFCIWLYPGEPFVVLLAEEDDGLFLLLSGRDVPSGNSLSIVCIGPRTAECSFWYELKVEDEGDESLRLNASPVNIREWKGVYPRMFLFVPDALSSMHYFDVSVCIRKTKQLAARRGKKMADW